MKIDRLLSITFNLLNRDIVSARELAERFEVSARTIVRDMKSLSMAGIPISSSTGAAGGYEILDTFKLNKQINTIDDYLFIITALKGLCSALENPKINNTLDKLLAVTQCDDKKQCVFIDFGVAKEGGGSPASLREIERAIHANVRISFDYTDSAGNRNRRLTEPAALHYRWYAWYLLGFCTYKNDYRLFKLNRIANLTVTSDPIAHKHENIQDLLEKKWKSDTRKIFIVKILCKDDVRVPVMEYLKGTIIEEFENGDFITEIHGIENERMWFSILLGFGNKIQVLEPQEIIDMLCEKSAEIKNMYNA